MKKALACLSIIFLVGMVTSSVASPISIENDDGKNILDIVPSFEQENFTESVSVTISAQPVELEIIMIACGLDGQFELLKQELESPIFNMILENAGAHNKSMKEHDYGLCTDNFIFTLSEIDPSKCNKNAMHRTEYCASWYSWQSI